MTVAAVTGGAGFIGSNFVLDWCAQTQETVLNIDKLTYAGNLENLASLQNNAQHIFVQADIANGDLMLELLTKHQPRAIINFAAESHVDRSIHGPAEFIQTNIVGTFNLLESVRAYYEKLGDGQKNRFRFLHVSTDEVYGELHNPEEFFLETTSYDPRSPYSASKASSDLIALSYVTTHGLPVVVTRCSNNFGPYQFPEKLIPLFTTNLLDGKKVPLYGDGGNVRDWIHVEDHNIAAHLVLQKGEVGQVYNIGAHNEITNREITYRLLELCGRDESSITPVADRLGHDRRYSVYIDKVSALGWKLSRTFEDSLAETVEWYRNNRAWWEPLKARAGL